MGNTGKIELTPEQERWLVRHFRHTTNPEIARRLGISETTMHRFARKLGLTKSRQHMRKTQRNAADKAKESHIRNGTYPPKGYIIPRSEEFRFKAGVTPVERLGKRKERQRIERSAESRRKTFREERARALFGVPRRTGLRVVREPRGKTCQRWYLRKRGYIIDEANLIAYWTDETRRATILEKRPRRWYWFRPMEIDRPIETKI
jgi:hypothetical protein